LLNRKAAVSTAAGDGFLDRNKKPRDATQSTPAAGIQFMSTGNRKDDAVYGCTHITEVILLKLADM
jgi:hypothetical protein